MHILQCVIRSYSWLRLVGMAFNNICRFKKKDHIHGCSRTSA